ncbi:MAG: hypothetical protein GY756_07320 [bacterium]|nr:hypothetical protein [bacterium]
MRLSKNEIEIAVVFSIIAIICFFILNIFSLIGVDIPNEEQLSFLKEIESPYFYTACIFLICFSYLLYFSFKLTCIYFRKNKQYKLCYIISIPVIFSLLCIYSPFFLVDELSSLNSYLGLWMTANFLGCILGLCFIMSLVEELNKIFHYQLKYQI